MTLLLAPAALAQPGTETKLTPSDPHPGQEFGAAVAIEGAVAVIGAFRDDPDFGALEYGAAYIFGYDGDDWVEVQKLRDSVPNSFDWFGWSVAVAHVAPDAWDIIVGTRNDELVANAQGAIEYAQCRGAIIIALVCTTGTTLVASDGEAGDHFGRALAADGDVLIAGAPQHDLAGFDEGAAYVYRYDGSDWIEEQKLTASDASDAAYFGEAVAISGNRVLVGAWGDSRPVGGQNAGAAYIFEFDGNQWVETAKLIAIDPGPQAQFGLSVALDGEEALIGAPLDNEQGSGAGAAYLFFYDGNEWDEGFKIRDSNHTGFNLFGSAVALDDSGILIGAENWAPSGGNSTGKAIYATDTFTYTLVPGDGGIGDLFGSAAAMDAGVLVIGAPSNVHPDGTGAAYVYGEPVGTSVEDGVQLASFLLSEAFPNPFRQQAQLTLMLAHAEEVHISVFDQLGREVRIVRDGPLAAGVHHIAISANGLPAGIYVVRVRAADFSASRRLTVVH